MYVDRVNVGPLVRDDAVDPFRARVVLEISMITVDRMKLSFSMVVLLNITASPAR
jgi:hypothetical protein